MLASHFAFENGRRPSCRQSMTPSTRLEGHLSREHGGVQKNLRGSGNALPSGSTRTEDDVSARQAGFLVDQVLASSFSTRLASAVEKFGTRLRPPETQLRLG